MSAELMKSKFVRPSVVCVAIISEPNAWISSKFWLWLPLGHTLGFFFSKLVQKIYSFVCVFTNMGAKILKRYCSSKLQPKVFKLSWIFFLMVLTKLHLGVLKFLSFWILTIFFLRKFQIHHCSLWRNQKPQLSGKRAIVEQTEWNVGLVGSTLTLYRVPLACFSSRSFWGHSMHLRFS